MRMAPSVARTALALTLLAVPAAAQQSVLPSPSPPLPRPRPIQPAKPASRPAQPPAQRQATPTARPSQQPVRRPVQAQLPTPPVPPAVVPVPAPAEPTEPAKPAEPLRGSNTGLPLPRFLALRSDEVNLRTGPGTRYPIEWVYKRRDLPVEVEREFEVWRLIRDQEGVKGWVHQATLYGRRTVVVTGGERALRREPGGEAAVAKLKPGVIGRLRSCEATSDWCQVQYQDYHGWLKRDEFWGIYPGEAVQ